MAYNSTLPTPKIEGALLASLKTKKIEYNITQDKSSNYASLTEAIAAVDDGDYKVKGIVLTFYTGTDWVSKRYNGEDASGFANEGNWIDVGGAAGGTQYLDLSMFTGDTGTLSEEDYQKVVKAYEDKITKAYLSDVVTTSSSILSAGDGSFMISCCLFDGLPGHIGIVVYAYIVNADKSYSCVENTMFLITGNDGTKALTDNGQYAEFAKPVKEISSNEGVGLYSIKPNTYYKYGTYTKLTISFAAEESGIINEYMFEFISGSTPTTLSLPDSVKWSGGSAPTIEANKTYQVSIVNNLAVYASF